MCSKMENISIGRKKWLFPTGIIPGIDLFCSFFLGEKIAFTRKKEDAEVWLVFVHNVSHA